MTFASGGLEGPLAGLLTGGFVLACGYLGIQLAVLLLNLATFPVLKPGPRLARGARVSILVPARDEERNLVDTLPRLVASDAHEIVVLDDGSSDRSRDVVLESAEGDPRVRLIDGRSLPDGWNGKNWACRQLADEATGDLLVFTDADVLWEPGTLDAVLALRDRHDAEYLSVWPRQRTVTLAERLAVPVIDLTLLGWLPYPAVRGLPPRQLSAGNGQLMLWTREGYARAGGHEAVRAEVLEDVRMGQNAKAAGLRVTLALGGRMLATRMYRSSAEVEAGFAKNILAAHSNSVPLLLFTAGISTLAYTLSFPLALVDPLWLVPGLLGVLQRLLTNLKCRRSPLEVALQPFLALPLWRITARVLRRPHAYSWKGRTYP